MKILITINPHINVTIKSQPKKKKGNHRLYDIYLHFSITENGIETVTPSVISTGLSVPVADWNKKDRRSDGKNKTLFNNELFNKLNLAKYHVETSRNENLKTCTQVKSIIETNIRKEITGKAQWGKRKELTEKQKQKTIDAVLNDLLTKRKLSPERARIYKHAVGILKQYFNNDVPLITNISKKDLIDFKDWYNENYKCTHGKRKGQKPAQDSTTTWFTMIAALFKHAEKNMEILPRSPLPEKFRGSFADIEKPVLTEEESLRIFNLDETTLTRSELVAKLCLQTCLLTGIGYGDLRSIKLEHLKKDNSAGKWYVKKPRNKTGKVFRIYLSARAYQSLYRLRELSGGTDTILKLPTIDYTNRMYKKLCLKAKVETHTTTYTLRHSYGVDYMDNGGLLEDLKVMLGNDWRNVEKYERISDKRLAEKTKQLEQKSKLHQL